MAQFAPAYEKTLGHEGGFSNHPADRGGMTWKGIARNFHPDWIGWTVIDQHLRKQGGPQGLEHNADLQRMVEQFYRALYWDRLRLDEIDSQPIANELFDSAVNCGVTSAGRWLQHSLNLVRHDNTPPIAEDSVVGLLTLGAVRTACKNGLERALLVALNGLQFERYHDLVERDPIQRTFIRGWLKRVGF